MKKLTKINLLNLSQAELAKRESTNLKGGNILLLLLQRKCVLWM